MSNTLAYWMAGVLDTQFVLHVRKGIRDLEKPVFQKDFLQKARGHLKKMVSETSSFTGDDRKNAFEIVAMFKEELHARLGSYTKRAFTNKERQILKRYRLKNLDLQVAAITHLKYSEIVTLGQLLQYTEKQLRELSVPGRSKMPSGALEDLKSELRKIGLSLREE